MLELDINHDLIPEVGELLRDFRKAQVSRYPILVQSSNDHKLYFFDSRHRFDDKSGLIGYLETFTGEVQGDKSCMMYSVYSKFIRNERRRKHTSEYNIKTTHDIKKALKMLKDYIKPMSTKEYLTAGSGRQNGVNHSSSQLHWKNQPMQTMRDIVRNLSISEMMKEFVRLKHMGVTFAYSALNEVTEKGEELQEEAERRAYQEDRWFVFFNPDDSLEVTRVDKDNNQIEPPKTYENLSLAPEDVQGKVTMLRINNMMGTYLGDVGLMVTSREFWLDIPR